MSELKEKYPIQCFSFFLPDDFFLKQLFIFLLCFTGVYPANTDETEQKLLLPGYHLKSKNVQVISFSMSSYFMYVLCVQRKHCNHFQNVNSLVSLLILFKRYRKSFPMMVVYSWNKYFDCERLIVSQCAFKNCEENALTFSSFYPELGLGAQVI